MIPMNDSQLLPHSFQLNILHLQAVAILASYCPGGGVGGPSSTPEN